MADNRMYLVCTQCRTKGEGVEVGDIVTRDFFTVAKWYPGKAYFVAQPDRVGKELNEWLEYHDHGSYEEFPVTFEYESEPETQWPTDDYVEVTRK
jgi:hypothetical protein